MNNKVVPWIGGAVALVIAIVSLVLALSYRSQADQVSNQLQQVTRQLQSVQSAEQLATRTAQQASNARLGLCWNATTDNSTFDVQSLQFEPPILSGGVYSCPSGLTFVSVAPAAGN